jgi:hypothetical protein
MLKNGEIALDPRTDRIEQFDQRSLNFPIREVLKDFHYTRPRSYTWRLRYTLNQKNQGACVGFAWAHELIARPAEFEGLDERFAREKVYWEAQKIDEWPGGVYPGAEPLLEGTSVLAGAKALQAAGYFKEYRWADTVWDLVAALGYRGPCIFGTRWYENMQEPNKKGFIEPTGARRNGHCLLAMGIKIIKLPSGEVDTDKSYIVLQNSWGFDWGIKGHCYLTLKNVQRLWEHADVCMPHGRIHQRLD